MTRNCVFVSQRFPPDKGGNAARVYDLATHLHGQDWEVTVLAPPPSYPPGEFDLSWRRKQTETLDGVSVNRLWTWQPQVVNPGMVRRLAYYLLFGIHAMLWLVWNSRRYDVVITTTPPISTGAPGLVAAALGKPWVVDVRDLWIDASISLGYLDAGSPLERVSRRFQRLVLHTATRNAVTTERLGELLCETYGESLDSKMIHVPNGVDTERFRPEPDGEADISDTPAAPSGCGRTLSGQVGSTVTANGGTQPDSDVPTIIYTGNLGSAQDLESCIRAMSHFSHDSAVLRLVGRGDVESDLRQLTADRDLGDRVEFVGAVQRDEIPAMLGDATIGIAPLKDMPELAYAIPTKVYEYMASGLPTLVTGRGEIERFVEESGGGVRTDNDPKRIAEQMDELLTDDQRRRELARNGREHVVENYDRRVIAQRLSDQLVSLIEHEP